MAKENVGFEPMPFKKEKLTKNELSEVGFEPTPTFVDQNAHSLEVKRISLESGALDRSAILTFLYHGVFLIYYEMNDFSNFDVL